MWKEQEGAGCIKTGCVGTGKGVVLCLLKEEKMGRDGKIVGKR